MLPLPGVVLPPDDVPVFGVVVPEPDDPVALPPETPVAGGVVVEVVPGVGGHGIAVPLVPTGPGVDAVSVAPGFALEFDAVCCPDVVVDGAAVCASGPASVAVLVVLLSLVGVPVELFT